MGFGHRVYKNFDPRSRVMKQSADEVLELMGIKDNPTLQVAKELEKIALEDEYFIEKKFIQMSIFIPELYWRQWSSQHQCLLQYLLLLEQWLARAVARNDFDPNIKLGDQDNFSLVQLTEVTSPLRIGKRKLI